MPANWHAASSLSNRVAFRRADIAAAARLIVFAINFRHRSCYWAYHSFRRNSKPRFLRAAWLRFHTVRPDDLPPGELRKLFIGIRNDLTSEEPTGNEGSVAATLRKMSNK